MEQNNKNQMNQTAENQALSPSQQQYKPQSTVLGIPTLVYLPFCFFNIISPLMSCLVAILGFVPKPQPKEDQTRVTDDDKDSIG
jgi:Na+/H+ antiporter NhaC